MSQRVSRIAAAARNRIGGTLLQAVSVKIATGTTP